MELVEGGSHSGTQIILETEIRAPIQIVFDCARGIEIHELSTLKTHKKAIAGRTSGLCELGDEVTWKARNFGIYQTRSSKITKMKAPHYFRDSMLKGAFSFIQHDHYFEEINGYTQMSNLLSYGVPYGTIGLLFDKIILKRYLSNLLKRRNEVIKEVAENE